MIGAGPVAPPPILPIEAFWCGGLSVSAGSLDNFSPIWSKFSVLCLQFVTTLLAVRPSLTSASNRDGPGGQFSKFPDLVGLSLQPMTDKLLRKSYTVIADLLNAHGLLHSKFPLHRHYNILES
jgi:hypothetical protein